MKFDFYGLTNNQEDIAKDLYLNNKHMVNDYTLDEVDEDMVDSWIEDAEDEGDEDYANFLRNAVEDNAEIFSLVQHLGGFYQPIGEVVVYD